MAGGIAARCTMQSGEQGKEWLEVIRCLGLQSVRRGQIEYYMHLHIMSKSEEPEDSESGAGLARPTVSPTLEFDSHHH